MADDRVIFEIRAENDQLKSKLAETETKLDQLKAKAEAADASGLGFRKSVQAVRSWVAAVGGAIGTALTFYAIGEKIRNTWDAVFTSGSTKAASFIDAVAGNEPVKRIQSLGEEIARLQNILGASNESVLSRVQNTIAEGTRESLQKRIDDLNAALDLATQANNADKSKAEQDAAAAKLAEEEKVRKTIFDRAREDTKRLAEEAMTQERRIEATRAEGLKRIQELTAQARTQEELTAVNALESQIVRRYQREREEMKRLNDEANQERIRQAEEQAQAYADEFRRQMLEAIQEINRANQSFFSSFSDKQNGLLLSIRQEITRIRGSIPSSGGAAGFGSGGSY